MSSEAMGACEAAEGAETMYYVFEKQSEDTFLFR